MIKKHSLISKIALLGAVFLIAGCTSTSPFGPSNKITSAPVQLPGVKSSSVQTSALPPLQGQNGNIVQQNTFDPNNPIDPNFGDPALNGQNANNDSSITNIANVGSSQITPAGRDLSGELTVAKLLGAWTLGAQSLQCRINLTQTTKSGTNRYRASAPNCQIPVISLISSWQLAGSQVQLYDESGAMIGAFQKSGIRFIGTLAGGVAASLDG